MSTPAHVYTLSFVFLVPVLLAQDYLENPAYFPPLDMITGGRNENFQSDTNNVTETYTDTGEPAELTPYEGGEGLDRSFRGFREVDEKALAASLPDNAKHLAPTFIEAGRKNNLDPVTLTAIAKHETGNFSSSAFRNKQNAMGVSNKSGPRSFASQEDSINYMASRIASPTGYYKNDQTLGDLWHTYSPPSTARGGVPVANDPRDLNKYWGGQVLQNVVKYEKATGLSK